MVNKRRQRFLDYFNGPPLKGSREALIRRTEYTKGRISQFFNEKQPFGERAASELAQRLGLPPDYFERDEPNHIYPLGEAAPVDNLSVLTAEEHRLVYDVRDLLPEDREHFLAEIRTRAAQMRKHAQLVLDRAGVTAPATDERVARHIKPAPPWQGEERRQPPPRPVEKDRRRVYYEYDSPPPPSHIKKRGSQ
jgi:hypothetical protein